MKILKVSLFAFLTCTVWSCSTDANFTEDQDIITSTTNLAEADILGTWTGIDVSYTGSITTLANGITTIQDIEGSNFTGNYTITFSESPNVVTGEGLYSIEEEITETNGDTSIDVINNLNLINSLTDWNLLENELIMNSNGKIMTTNIIEHTNTTLVLTIDENISSTINGISKTLIKNSVFTFIR